MSHVDDFRAREIAEKVRRKDRQFAGGGWGHVDSMTTKAILLAVAEEAEYWKARVCIICGAECKETESEFTHPSNICVALDGVSDWTTLARAEYESRKP